MSLIPSYIINRTDGSVLTTINPGNVDGTSTSITLYGHQTLWYGEGLEEGIIHILENFSNSSSPPNPLSGQLWWNRTNGSMHVYATNPSTGATVWAPIGVPVYSPAIAPTGVFAGQLWLDPTNHLLKYYTGTDWLSLPTGGMDKGSSPPSGANNIGALWYDTTHAKVMVWNGSMWADIGLSGSAITLDYNTSTGALTVQPSGSQVVIPPGEDDTPRILEFNQSTNVLTIYPEGSSVDLTSLATGGGGGGTYTLPAATSAVLGGVVIDQTPIAGQAPLSIDVVGNLTVPIASSSTLGVVKAGTNITIAPDGTISSTASGSGAVTSVNGNTGVVVLGASDVGAAPVAHVGSSGTSHAVATTSTAGFMSAADKTKLDSISTSASYQEVILTTNTTLEVGKTYIINWHPLTLTLPASGDAQPGDEIIVIDNLGLGDLTFSRNFQLINAAAMDFSMNVTGPKIFRLFRSETFGWWISF